MTQHHDPVPPKRRLTAAYLLFHVLLSVDTWRIVFGTTLAVVLAPHLLPLDRTGIGRYVMFITVVVIGWAISKAPAEWIVRQLRLRFPDK